MPDKSKLNGNASTLALAKALSAVVHQAAEAAMEPVLEEMTDMEGRLNDRITQAETRLNSRIDTGLDTTNQRIDTGLDTTNQRIDTGLEALNQRIDTGLDTTNKNVQAQIAKLYRDMAQSQ